MKAEDLLMGLNELQDDLVLNAQIPNRKPAFRKRKLMALLTAAVIASMLGMTAFASTDGTHWLREFFAQRSDFVLSDSQKDYIAENAVAVQKSQTQNGYTLTLDTAISDGVYTYIRFQLEAPEAVVLDARSYAPQNWKELDMINENGEPFTGSGGWDTVDDNLADNAVSLIYTRFHMSDEDNYDSIFGHTWNLRIDGLKGNYIHNYGTPEMTFEEVDVTEGIWEFQISFPARGNEVVEFITEPVDCPIYTNIGIQGWHYEDVAITSLKVRALSASLSFRHPKTENINGRFDNIYAVMKDSSMAKLNGSSGAPDHLTYKFDAPIVVADIDHILLPDGTKLPMPQA